jgi:hypothetical protein
VGRDAEGHCATIVYTSGNAASERMDALTRDVWDVSGEKQDPDAGGFPGFTPFPSPLGYPVLSESARIHLDIDGVEEANAVFTEEMRKGTPKDIAGKKACAAAEGAQHKARKAYGGPDFEDLE